MRHREVMRKNAMTPFRSFFDEMERYFDNDKKKVKSNLKIDIIENENYYLVEAEVPGIEKKNISISADNDELIIEAEIKDQEEERNYIRRERTQKHFRRVLGLGNDVDKSKISANLKNGLLKIKLAKKEEAAPSKIEVK